MREGQSIDGLSSSTRVMNDVFLTYHIEDEKLAAVRAVGSLLRALQEHAFLAASRKGRRLLG